MRMNWSEGAYGEGSDGPEHNSRKVFKEMSQRDLRALKITNSWFEVLDCLLVPYWKAVGLAFNCTFLLFGYAVQLIACARRKDGCNQSTEEIKRNPSEVRKLQENNLRAALQQASDHGSLAKPKNMDVSETIDVEDKSLGKIKITSKTTSSKRFSKSNFSSCRTNTAPPHSKIDYHSLWFWFIW